MSASGTQSDKDEEEYEDAMSASGTDSDKDEEEEDEISEYLSRENVVAVDLPKKLGKGPTYTYPSLILDAASGAGKTQQAFALVKEHKTIIYFLLSDPPTETGVTDQPVYQGLRALTKDEGDIRFAIRVDEAMKALSENEKNKNVDICAVDFLRSRINGVGSKPIEYKDDCWFRNAGSDDIGLPFSLLMDVVLWMCSKRLQYNNNNKRLDPVPITLGDNTNVKFANLYSQLENLILFVDEALPMGAGDRPDPRVIVRLRFVRNLGRALTMKVVIAGTDATAANMIAVASASRPGIVASRTAPSDDMAWIECQFLSSPMLPNDVKKVVFPNLASPNQRENDLISELARGRPYLVHLFARALEARQINSNNLAVVLEDVGMILQREKRMSAASNFIYLSGAFLAHKYTISPCGFNVKPAALVRGHFFEPCAVVDKKGSPVFGLLMGERSLSSGHLRVKVYRYYLSESRSIMWCASIGDDTKPRPNFCSDFSGIEFSLTACVQQCLAREPLLALALSAQCRMDKETFRKALSMVYQETSPQLTVGETDGELHEHIMFAVLQLASNRKTLADDGRVQTLSGDRVKLGTSLQNVEEYLTNGSDSSFVECAGEFYGELKDHGALGTLDESGEPHVSLKSILGIPKSALQIDDHTGQRDKITMPWLVPACSLSAWKDTRARASSLFDGIDIAGLVPGSRNAAFDADAYSWKNLPMDAVSESKDVPEWVFEFKARKSAYSIDEARKHLKKKCLLRQKELPPVIDQPNQTEGDEPEKEKARLTKETTDNLGEVDQLPCHAVLIAVVGGHDTCCDIRYSGAQKYLRVVLIVGLGRKMLGSKVLG